MMQAFLLNRLSIADRGGDEMLVRLMWRSKLYCQPAGAHEGDYSEIRYQFQQSECAPAVSPMK